MSNEDTMENEGGPPVNEDTIFAGEQPEVKPLTTGQLVTAMLEIRDERKELKRRDKILIGLWRDLETQFLAQLDEQGQKRAGTDAGTATITENVLPTIVDWDALTAYIVKEDATHLLQRRVSAAAFRELRDAGMTIPGVEPYLQRQISLRRRTT